MSDITPRFIIGAVLMTLGLIFYAIQFIGVFRFRYILNRIHASAIGDNLGSGLMLLGTIVMRGLSLTSLKFAIIIIFLWFTAPASTHMLAKMEVLSKKSLDEVAADTSAITYDLAAESLTEEEKK